MEIVSRNKLDPQQSEFIANIFKGNGNLLVNGFPGSGKTVLLEYAIDKIRAVKPEAKIIIVEFTHSLIKMLKQCISEISGITDIPVVTYFDFRDNYSHSHYDYIICDEVQDIPVYIIELFKRCADRVIVAGDSNQRLYAEEPGSHRPTCSPSDLSALLSPASTNLNIIHRLNKNIIAAVTSFMPELDLMNGHHSMLKKSVQVRFWKCSSQQDEANRLVDAILPYAKLRKSVGILLPSHQSISAFVRAAIAHLGKPAWNEKYDTRYSSNSQKWDYTELNKYFNTNGLPFQVVINDAGDFTAADGKIIIMTYHGSKGLDFDTVALPFCEDFNHNSLPGTDSRIPFMVAMTRSRENLFISSSSNRTSGYVMKFFDKCLFKDWTTETNPQLPFNQEEDKDDSPFGF